MPGMPKINTTNSENTLATKQITHTLIHAEHPKGVNPIKTQPKTNPSQNLTINMIFVLQSQWV